MTIPRNPGSKTLHDKQGRVFLTAQLAVGLTSLVFSWINPRGVPHTLYRIIFG